jgi:PAS domain S-box-containing protein
MTATGPIRALVVDDSEFFAEMTAATLTEEHDIEATFETNAQAALDWLEESQVDCIVSDYEMPGMDGLAFFDRVQDRYDDLPFILLTGRGDEEVASQAIASSVADYLLKLEVVEDEQYERLANRIVGVVTQQQTQKKYERLVENSPDAIAHVTESGTILATNPALVEGVDTDCESLVGTQLVDTFEGTVWKTRLGAGQEAIKTGETVRTEDSYDGRFFHNIFVPVETLRAHDSFQLISRDITERREREEELERQNERLESFVSIVSHDLRNPLNVAQSSVELLHGESDSDHLDRIDRSLVRMEAIIEDVLTLARQGDTVDAASPVDLRTMAEDAWSYIETGESTLVVETDSRIEADPSRLKELLTNLFRNSVEHGEATTITVGSIGESNADDYGFYVADDGTGISPENRDEIFESGFSTGRQGTGLGLTIVEEIANAHDWSVTVADRDGDGARIEVTGVTER